MKFSLVLGMMVIEVMVSTLTIDQGPPYRAKWSYVMPYKCTRYWGSSLA